MTMISCDLVCLKYLETNLVDLNHLVITFK